MKKVWILEKFETHEEMVKYLKEYEEMIKNQEVNNSPDKDEKLKMFLDKYRAQVEENPEGRWIGFEGKTIYSQFCNVAKQTIKMYPGTKFRVVEGEIPDDAKFWPGYKFIKENEGVLRYLMVTK